ncbi:MAG: biotin-dependent carboxyltransferase family protein [Opitutae bacterium]|nr:biotin-dependent carboxyltransferase family protein [Opitutae bacterium]
MLTVLKPGLLTTVQDLGRFGYQKFGVVVGGALDRFAARVANAIVGNDDNAAVLEMAQLGPELRFERDTLIAWGGAEFDARLGGEPLPADRAVAVRAGETIAFGAARAGVRAWLAVAGGIDVPLVLGSRTTYRRGGFGGFEGRPLRAGDRLRCGDESEWAARYRSTAPRFSAWSVRPHTLGKPAPAGVVRALRGPEWEWFGAEAHREFFASEWRATKDADRMGVRLAGPALPQRESREMISEGVADGVVQVPAGGAPIVLLASRQTVGGYPRIAAVATVDIGRVAQLAPGRSIRFQEIAVAEAHVLYLARERDLNRVRTGLVRLAG